MNLIFFKFIKSGLSIYAPYTHTPGYKLSSAQHAQIMQTVIIFSFLILQVVKICGVTNKKATINTSGCATLSADVKAE